MIFYFKIKYKNSMNTKKYFNKLAAALLFLAVCVSNASAQAAKPAAPREEKLLNGLKLLIWNQPNAEKITVKLRVHSGAAFDPQNKEGAMALLGEILFPNETIKEFFREDLGGSLEVTSNYDYIQINATANSDQFLTLLETLAGAVTNPQIDKETTAKIRAVQIEKVKELEKSPAYIADQTVAKRLFGDFPYGRAPMGTSDSLQKIDFADLILAKQKFLTPDNATVAISGSVKPDFALRAAKRYFGSWVKADKKVPATFTQPNPPDTKFFLIKTEINNASELRFAFRGLARSEKDYYAAQILTSVLQNRLQKKEGSKFLLRQESYFLSGLVLLKLSDLNPDSITLAGEDVLMLENFFNYTEDLLKPNVSAEEFQIAKNYFLKNFNAQDVIESWLNADTFRLASIKTDSQTAQNATLADVQRVLERWRKEAVVKTLLIKVTG